MTPLIPLALAMHLHGFFYRPSPPLPTNDGWSVYLPRDEYGRKGIRSRSKVWQFTDINKDQNVSCLYSHQEAIYRRSLVTIVLVHLSSSSSSSDENQRYGLVICFQVPRQEYMSDTCSLALTMYDTTPILHLRCSKALQGSSIT